jgi:hypothetical protein
MRVNATRYHVTVNFIIGLLVMYPASKIDNGLGLQSFTL